MIGEQVAHIKSQGNTVNKLLYQKDFGIKAFKGAEISDDQMAKINKYALETLQADQVHVRKFLLAHNMIDRDNERFPEGLLDDFAKTLPGKSFLFGHSRNSPGKGLWFEAEMKEISPAEFQELTGEEARLPEGVKTVNALMASAYLMKIPANEETLANIDGGVYRHVSIGFHASDIKKVEEKSGSYYWEYSSPGEALEGSIVWLGAQPGATAQKTLMVGIGINDKSNKDEGDKNVEKILQNLSALCGKSLTADNAVEEVKSILETQRNEVSDLKARVEELTPLASDGKAYRGNLVSKYVASKAKLGEVEETPEAQDKVKSVISSYPMDFLKSEVEVLEKRVMEKFPDSALHSADPDAERDGGKVNPLIPSNKK